MISPLSRLHSFFFQSPAMSPGHSDFTISIQPIRLTKFGLFLVRVNAANVSKNSASGSVFMGHSSVTIVH